MKKRNLVRALAVAALAIPVAAVAQNGSAASASSIRGAGIGNNASRVMTVHTGTVQYLGKTTLSGLASQASDNPYSPNETAPNSPGEDNGFPSDLIHGLLDVPSPSDNGITQSNPATLASFRGLNHLQQRLASNGNQFSLEPPDQCNVETGGVDLEGVNNALAIYNTSGSMLAGPISLNDFWRLPPGINRTTGAYGPFVGDINCLLDPATGHIFLTAFDLETDPSAGGYTGGGGTLIAVSSSRNPLGSYALFKLDTTDTAPDTQNPHPSCPCFGDQPRIGTDLNGFYLSVNEFSNSNNPGPGFYGAEVYAIAKNRLVAIAANPGSTGYPAAGLPRYVKYENLVNNDYEAFNSSVEPAMSAGRYDASHGGTEYFLSSNDYGYCLDNRITAWALTDTLLLNTASGIPAMQSTEVTTPPYGCPNPAQQKAGPQPLTTASYCGEVSACGAPLEYLNTDDERMQQVVYAHGQLWSALDTRIVSPDSTERSGIEWFRVQPAWAAGAPTVYSPALAGAGYITAGNEYTLYPAIAANNAGNAAISYSISGTDYYPSAAYSIFNPQTNSFGRVHITALGGAPEDGFTGYEGGVCYTAAGTAEAPCARWGDYSAANADPVTGKIWMATEWIEGNGPTQRSSLANWSTYITEVNPNQVDSTNQG